MTRLVAATIAFVTLLTLVASAQAAPYAQLSSSRNQLGSTTPTVVELDHNDAVKSITNTNGRITFEQAGAYFLMAAAQVGSVDGKGQGVVRLWMRTNGKDVANSNSEQTILPGFTAVLVTQGLAEIKAGDTMELAYSVSAPDEKLGLIASAPAGEPAVPSMIFSAFKVDDTAYAQLSSTETQIDAAGKTITLNSTDAAKDVENQAGVVTCKTAGTYLLMAAGQVGCTAAGEKGRVRIWMRQNGQDVSNSNSEQTVHAGFTAVLVCQGVVACKAGDRLEIVQSATGSGLGLVASTPAGEPSVPSLILSLVKVTDDAYAQLSSLEPQFSAWYEKLVRLDHTDAAQNVENAGRPMARSINKGTIAVQQDGVYFAIAAGQVGSAEGNGQGSVRLWLRKGGRDVEKSNAEQTIQGDYTTVLVTQGVGEAKAGSRFQLFHAATGTGVGLVAVEPKGEPAVPSMIFTMVRVD